MPDPTLKPKSSPTAAFTVVCGGTTSTQQDPKGLDEIVVQTHIDQIGMCELSYHGHNINPSDLKPGVEVTVEIGGNSIKTFSGFITSVSHQLNKGKENIKVLAMDPLVKLANSNATKVWGGKTTDKFKDSDVASEVISAGGCTAGTVDATSGERPYIMQRAESNLAFLKRLAARNGYLVYAEDGKVHFKKPQFSDSPKEISGGDVIKVDMTRSDMGIPSKVSVIGWDYIGKTQVGGELGAGGTTGIGGGSAPSPVTYGGDMHISDVFVDSDSGAKGMAEGEMNRFSRGAVKAKITVESNGAVTPGTKVKMTGNFTSFNMEGLVVGTRHVVQAGMSSQTTLYVVGNTDPE